MKSAFLSIALLGAVLASCAGNTVGAGAGDGVIAPSGTVRRSDVISEAELVSSNTTSVLEAVQQLRPRFLRTRGTNADDLVVYLDGSRLGGVSTLQSLHPSEILEVRYLDGPQASSRFGMYHSGGALLVTRKRSPTS